MNGPHDFGGQMGYDGIVPEAENIIFHHDWEKRMLAVNIAAGGLGLWSIDESRYSKEVMTPQQYLGAGYYERWMLALEVLLVQHGMVTPEELKAGRSLHPPSEKGHRHSADELMKLHAIGGFFERPATQPARFDVGQAVITRNDHPVYHTRLPRYARGRRGTIDLVHAMYVYPDSVAQRQGENPEWLYTVRFDATELWGASADPASTVSIDAWESYLEFA